MYLYINQYIPNGHEAKHTPLYPYIENGQGFEHVVLYK